MSSAAEDAVAVLAGETLYGGALDHLAAGAEARAAALERILDAAERDARDSIVYLPGPRIEHDDPRRERWAEEGRALQRDIALVGGRCFARLHHGPGHQSTTRCELRGPHDVHRADVLGDRVQWRGEDSSTGFFDEPPDLGEEPLVGRDARNG